MGEGEAAGGADRPSEWDDAAYESAACGFAITTLDGLLVRVNRTLAEWLGYEPREMVQGMRFVDLLSRAGKVFHETHYAPLLHMQGLVNEFAFDMVSRRGERIAVLVSARAGGTEHGERRVHVVVFRATQRREYERALLAERRQAEELARARFDYLAMLSHEVRNPLHCIVSVGALLAGQSGPERRYVEILRAASSHLLSVVDNVLDYSKLEAGKMILESRRFALRTVVQNVVRTNEVRALGKPLAFQAHVDERIPEHLRGDAVKLTQVLTNLLGNAVKFTARGSIDLAVELVEWHDGAVAMQFSVADTGIGIAPDRLASVFDEYTQAEASTSREFGGTGLGLTISRRLVELFGGRLEVESEPGVGTRFWFVLTFPIAEDDEESDDGHARPLQ